MQDTTKTILCVGGGLAVGALIGYAIGKRPAAAPLTDNALSQALAASQARIAQLQAQYDAAVRALPPGATPVAVPSATPAGGDPAIARLQRALTVIGRYTGPVTGVTSPAFQAALDSYRADKGIAPGAPLPASMQAELDAIGA